MEEWKYLKISSHIFSVFSAFSPFDWSLKMSLCLKNSVIGYQFLTYMYPGIGYQYRTKFLGAFVILIFSTREFVIEDSVVQRDLPKIWSLFREMDF